MEIIETRSNPQAGPLNNLRSIAAFLALLLSVAFLTGCSSSTNAAGWRGTVEKYIDVQGKGDPNILRGVTWPQSRRGFSVIGGDLPRESQDAKGLLLSVEQVNNRPWFVFIVGVVNHEAVESIHVEALNVQGNAKTWKSSADDPKALAAYNDYYDHLWKQRFPGRTAPPAQYTNFPKEQDQFEVTQQPGGKIVVTHPLSGARWEVVVDPKAPPPQPSSPTTNRRVARTLLPGTVHRI
jgi:hypothetical protein